MLAQTLGHLVTPKIWRKISSFATGNMSGNELHHTVIHGPFKGPSLIENFLHDASNIILKTVPPNSSPCGNLSKCRQLNGFESKFIEKVTAAPTNQSLSRQRLTSGQEISVPQGMNMAMVNFLGMAGNREGFQRPQRREVLTRSHFPCRVSILNTEHFCILERMAKCTLNRLTSVFLLKLLLEVKSLSKPPKKSDLLDKVSKKRKTSAPLIPGMPYLNPSHTDTHLTYTHPMDNHYCPIQGRVFRCGFQGASPTVRPFGAIKVDETKLVRKCSQPMLGLDLNGAKKTSPTRSDVNPTVGGRPQSPHRVIASELLSENSPSWGNLDMAEGKTKSVAFTCGWVGFSYRHLRDACGILHPNESHPQNSFQWIICRIGICAENALSSRYCSLWPMLWLHL